MTKFTARDKHHEACREVRFRERVYARMVAVGRMKQSSADMGISLMRAIADDYAKIVEAEDGKERLI